MSVQLMCTTHKVMHVDLMGVLTFELMHVELMWLPRIDMRDRSVPHIRKHVRATCVWIASARVGAWIETLH